MTKLTLNIKKSVEENAEIYFEKAKKARKKIEGIKTALEKSKVKIEQEKKRIKEKEKKLELEKKEKAERKLEWYEKFRWFFTSEGFLVIGGRDATTNEIIIKKHAEKDDVVFHTDMSGSPFFVIKTKGKKVSETSLKEVADATCTYSKAWKLGLTTTPTFYVKPEQVTKKAKPGEYLPKGAFMIEGKTNYIHSEISFAVGITPDKRIMGGPLSAVKKNCEKIIRIEPGREKTSAVAKKIKAEIGGSLDEIIKAIPAGGCKIKK
ncbi:DUF814 domain-containing protein [Candidatus Woesearchaeota archaeon]|nr:DUF814 domain-containing protein [Candidatus Woesearchaeota archaeon]